MTKQLLFFGPPDELGAFGFTDTWTDQGIAQIQLLLDHLRQDTEIAEALHILGSLPSLHKSVSKCTMAFFGN
jgi:hypothetical protein